MEQTIKDEMKNIKDALVYIGFAEEEAENQIEILNRIVAAEIIDRIIKANPNESLDSDNIATFIKEHYSEQDLVKISMAVSEPIVKDYFDEITKDLTESRKEYFYKFIE